MWSESLPVGQSVVEFATGPCSRAGRRGFRKTLRSSPQTADLMSRDCMRYYLRGGDLYQYGSGGRARCCSQQTLVAKKCVRAIPPSTQIGYHQTREVCSAWDEKQIPLFDDTDQACLLKELTEGLKMTVLPATRMTTQPSEYPKS